MSDTEKLMKVQDLLNEVQLLSPWTLGLKTTCLDDLMDDINLRLNPDTFDD